MEPTHIKRITKEGIKELRLSPIDQSREEEKNRKTYVFY
jgi:hypothetical protein